MDIDLENDLRRDSDDEESDEEKRSDSENENSKANDVEKVMKKANEVAKKKVTKRPRPKLDVDRLSGPKGLEELCHLFKDEKFKDKGYEFENLETLMNKFKYWAHRLVPHLAFDDFIEKAENLGGKKPIKHTLERLRDKLNIQSNSNETEELSHTLLDILPTIDAPLVSNDIPDDDELDELMR